jgi:hypothetical protein
MGKNKGHIKIWREIKCIILKCGMYEGGYLLDLET